MQERPGLWAIPVAQRLDSLATSCENHAVLPFNSFTIHSLVAVMVTASISAVFLVIYFIGHERRSVDVLFALYVGACAVGAFVYFLEDNFVPAGRSSSGWEGGPSPAELAAWTLWAQRLLYAIAGLILALRLHFVIKYCHVDNAVSRHPKILYLLCLAMLPLIAHPLFITSPAGPRAPTSSWTCAIPWMGEVGPLALVFVALWLLSEVYVLATLYRFGWRASRQVLGPLRHVKLVFIALAADTVLIIGDTMLGMAGWAGIAIAPLATLISGVILAIALIRDHKDISTMELKLRTARQRLLTAREEERQHIARDLHDSFAQDLIVLQMGLSAGLGSADTTDPASATLIRSAVDRCRQLAREIRHICYGLYPPGLRENGLIPAIEQLIRHIRQTGIEARLHC